jgi:DNA-binding winged helix-turn-helix (wHTH) protein
MKSGSFRFDRFTLDAEDRMLRRDDAVLDVSSRYFDALVLLVSEAGGLVSKDRFMDEVWRGVPVTDEALTQCIRNLRRELGDDATNPRFIETIPKHGYRFVATVERGDTGKVLAAKVVGHQWRDFFALGGAGIVGGGLAGLLGGIFYGFAGAAQPLAPGMGAASIVLVMTSLTVLIALIGAAGVSFGIAATRFVKQQSWQWTVGGGALGGLLVGGIVKLLGLDAFHLLLGQSPGNITGAPEGAMLGAAVGLGVWLSNRGPLSDRFFPKIVPAALVGGIAGAAIPALGGRLLGGSLALLAELLPQSRLRLDQIGAFFGEDGFGPISHIVTGAMEGILFAACVAGAILLARRQLAVG